MRFNKSKRGYTLIELIVTIGIGIVLLSLLVEAIIVIGGLCVGAHFIHKYW